VFLHYLGENHLSNFHVFNNYYWFYFHKTYLFSIPTLHACVNVRRGQFEHFLLKLSSFVSVLPQNISVCLSVCHTDGLSIWLICSHVTLEVDRGMSWTQAVSRLDSNPGSLNGFYVSRRETHCSRHWFVLATLKDASTHVFRIARFTAFSLISSSSSSSWLRGDQRLTKALIKSRIRRV